MMVFSTMNHHVFGPACLVIAALLTVHEQRVGAYKILMIPIPGRSHLFSMAAMAEGLAGRGHRVSLLVGENFPADDLPEVRNSTAITVVRYGDSDVGGGTMDYEAVFENVTTHAMVRRVDMWSLIPIIRSRCDVHFCTRVQYTPRTFPSDISVNKIAF